MSINNVIEILNPIFDEFSYKYTKSKKTWYKKDKKIILICEYQKSRFSNNFFLNLGIYFQNKYEKNKRTVSIDDCHLIARYDQLYKDFSVLDIEDEYFGDFLKLKKELSFTTQNIKQKLLPMFDSLIGEKYDKMNFNDYPNEHWNLQNVTEEDYKKMFI